MCVEVSGMRTVYVCVGIRYEDCVCVCGGVKIVYVYVRNEDCVCVCGGIRYEDCVYVCRY